MDDRTRRWATNGGVDMRERRRRVQRGVVTRREASLQRGCICRACNYAERAILPNQY